MSKVRIVVSAIAIASLGAACATGGSDELTGDGGTAESPESGTLPSPPPWQVDATASDGSSAPDAPWAGDAPSSADAIAPADANDSGHWWGRDAGIVDAPWQLDGCPPFPLPCRIGSD